jgi:hypothetical protein
MKRTLLTTLALLAMVACSQPPPPPARERVIALYLTENDGDSGNTPVRMLVTPKFLRIDGGTDGNDFLLYDRATRTSYNVSPTDRLVLVIPPRTLPSGKATNLKHRVKRDTAVFPAVAGRTVIRYQLLTNGRLCYDLYAADGLLPEAVAALREYREALAGEQGAAIGFTPPKARAPCDLANHVYTPARHLMHGFPVRVVEIDARDPKRKRITELTDYRTDFEVAAELFKLPESYRRMTLKELRSR